VTDDEGVRRIHKEEARCNEKTAIDMMQLNHPWTSYVSTLKAALGIPLIVDETVPRDVVQFWQDGKMVREIRV
jgi:hypothetical protein